MEVDLKDYVSFDVTGVDMWGRRFRMTYNSDKPGFYTAFGINLFKGSVWGVLPNGTRKLLRRV